MAVTRFLDRSMAAGRAKITTAARLAAQFRAHVRDGLALPELLPIFRGTEGAAVHAVNIQITVQMIDFVLKNSRVPARSLDAFGIAAVVKTLHAHAARARNQSKKSGQAETALEKFHDLAVFRAVDSRIDEDMKGDRPPFAKLQLLGRNFLVVFLAVFDYRDLER